VIALWIFILIAAGLVLLRPSPVTWAFYVFSLSWTLAGTLILEYASTPMFAFLILLTGIAATAASVAFVVFALRFPDNPVSGALATVEKFLLWV